VLVQSLFQTAHDRFKEKPKLLLNRTEGQAEEEKEEKVSEEGEGEGEGADMQGEEKEIEETSSSGQPPSDHRLSTSNGLGTIPMSDRPIIPIILNFSAQTSAKKTQETIESKLYKVRRNQLGAPAGKRVVVFVDDVNMPAVEEYGAQPPIELLRQFQDHKGFYDRQKLTWKSVQDTTLLCAAAPPGGGRNELTQRFTRHFNVLCLPRQSETGLKKIFGAVLGGFMADFKPPVQKLSEPLVAATVELYLNCCAELLPTPAKSHYTFNLRDISKVFQGMLMIRPIVCENPETMIRLWIHENQRCFSDRLISDDDRLWFSKKITTMLNRHFSVSWSHEDLFEEEPILFADFLRPGSEKVYEESKNRDELGRLLKDYLEEYNLSSTSSKMDLVFFEDAIAHLSRISRIISQPRGNAMLVGVGGSGKQSLTRLACAIAEYQCMEMEITRNFGYNDFQEFLKKVMLMAGVQGKHVVFLFNENQIVEERFLEDINNILNTGEVPNLFPNDELMKLIEDLSPVVKEMGLTATRNVVYNTFVQRVRDHLHIVLCMSPVGEAFRTRCRMFPSLINCCTIDWYSKWPETALHEVSAKFLSDVMLSSDDVRSALGKLCVLIHQSVEQASDRFAAELSRRVYTTPKSYLDLIRLYLSMLSERRDRLSRQAERLKTGLTKLKDTKEVVAELRETLEKLKPVLLTKTKETETMLALLANDQQRADMVKAVVEVEEKMVSKQAAECREIAADAQADLDSALPAYRDALKALEKLKKQEISEIKSMSNPPAGVQKTMEAVCILLGAKEDWETAKKVLANVNFLKTLRDYDKDNIEQKVINKITNKYLKDPTLTNDKMQSVSKAAASLMDWVRAIILYSEVSKKVAPKQKHLEQMNAVLQAAESKLKEKQDQMAQVVANVTMLKNRCEATLAEKNKLDLRTQQTEARLVRAEKLTSGLAGEQTRWTADLAQIGLDLEKLVGDCFVSAACVSYLGPFTGEYRELAKKWVSWCQESKIPISDSFALRSVMGSPIEIRDWNMQGLPTDTVSIDSGIIAKRSHRWPLMIDPQEQAKKWIQNEYASSRLVVTRFTDRHMLRDVESAVKLGYPVLIEDIEEYVDAALDPLLLRQVFEGKTGDLMIRLGENIIPYNPNFRLFLTTKLSNPHYLPETCIKVALINFTVTRQGLEDQLLGDVVKHERPEVEEKKNRLVVSMAEDRKQLQDLEDKILRLLSESSGNILDDQDLITALDDSKQMSNIIHERVKETAENERILSSTREAYRPVATRGSVLYFVVADLALIDPMYQYSLSYFMRLFNICLSQSVRSDNLSQRLANMIQHVTWSIFANISRGCFENHKALFAFLICAQILRQAGEIQQKEWNLLLRPIIKTRRLTERQDRLANPDDSFISATGWELLCRLEDTGFAGLTPHVVNSLDAWKQWVAQPSPMDAPLPDRFESEIPHFQRLILLKALKPDKLVPALSAFVGLKMGEAFTSPIQPSLEDVFKDTDIKTPVVFVLSQGADPTGLLFRFARDKNFSNKLNVISLGQGQGDNARRMIEVAKKQGEWVLLQNCHLAKSWMGELETIVDGFQHDERIHPDFRLWLTSMPCSYFPVSVLQHGVKLTNEPPRGLKANLIRSYTNVVNPEDFEGCSKPEPWKKLVFGLCFFHAVIQERKKFGPLGWNIMYEFNDSDLETSLQVLRMFLEEQSQIPWDALRYVCGEINYGGRVTDDWDRRCLNSILKCYYTPDILTDKYPLSSSGIYYTPSSGLISSYISYLSNLPAEADPEVFGMHENANLTFQYQETKTMLNTLLSIQPREVVSASGLSNDQVVADLAREMEEKMPHLLDRRQLQLRLQNGSEEKDAKEQVLDSLTVVLGQEMDRFNLLLSTMKRTLQQIQKAIKGEVVMSLELDKMYTSLLNNQVPELWEKVAYPSLKPLASWVKDLHQRIAFMTDWLANGKPNCFWLSGFFFPQGFMTGVLQSHARKYRIPIDTLSFAFHVTQFKEAKDVERPPEDGVYIHGLQLDGARWDEKQQVIDDAKLGELFYTMPVIHFLPTQDYQRNPKHYACPVYKTSVRAGVLSTTGQSTNFVLEVHLPTLKSPDYWVLQGTALLCQLNN